MKAVVRLRWVVTAWVMEVLNKRPETTQAALASVRARAHGGTAVVVLDQGIRAVAWSRG